MRQQARDPRGSVQVIRRHGVLAGIAAAAGLLAGAVFAAFSPVMVTSTASVLLPPLPGPVLAATVVIARSDPVLAGALPRVSPAASLETLRGEVQVKSVTRYVLSVSASARTAAQAEATANAVADSYIGYTSSAGSPAGRVQARLLAPAISATGTRPLVQVLLGALLGLVSGALTGVTAALVSRGPAHDLLSASGKLAASKAGNARTTCDQPGSGYPAVAHGQPDARSARPGPASCPERAPHRTFEWASDWHADNPPGMRVRSSPLDAPQLDGAPDRLLCMAPAISRS
jgi:hypothetical protein